MTCVKVRAKAGAAASAILDEARTCNVGLIVMATHGHSGLNRLRYGSVAEAVLRLSSPPVLLVRAWQPSAPARQVARPRLVVPLDGSAFAEAALPVAVDVATRLHGDLVLVTAIPYREGPFALDPLEETGADGERRKELVADVRGYLQQQRDRLLLSGFGADIRIDACVGPPSPVIETLCRQHAAALVVLATHGLSGLARLVLGSTADGLLRHGTTPLVLVRPSELPDEVALLQSTAVQVLLPAQAARDTSAAVSSVKLS